eukprot:879860-Prymnesium_polylepis.1
MELVNFLLSRGEGGGEATAAGGDEINANDARSAIMAAIHCNDDVQVARLLAQSALNAKSPVLHNLSMLSALPAAASKDNPVERLKTSLEMIGRLERVAHELTAVVGTHDGARVDWCLVQPLLYSLAFVKAGSTDDDELSWRCAATLACIG